MTGLWLGLGTLGVATLFGLFWRRRQGRVQNSAGSKPAASVLPEPVLHRVDRAATVTLLQLNTPICARCPQARAVLGELAAATAGIRHTELNLAAHPQLVSQLHVRSTPTTLALSRTGHELFRVTGVPRRAELLAALRHGEQAEEDYHRSAQAKHVPHSKDPGLVGDAGDPGSTCDQQDHPPQSVQHPERHDDGRDTPRA